MTSLNSFINRSDATLHTSRRRLFYEFLFFAHETLSYHKDSINNDFKQMRIFTVCSDLYILHLQTATKYTVYAVYSILYTVSFMILTDC